MDKIVEIGKAVGRVRQVAGKTKGKQKNKARVMAGSKPATIKSRVFTTTAGNVTVVLPKPRDATAIAAALRETLAMLHPDQGAEAGGVDTLAAAIRAALAMLETEQGSSAEAA